MRRLVGAIIVLVCLGVLVHDGTTGRLSVFRECYDVDDLHVWMIERIAYRQPRRVQVLLRRGGAGPARRNEDASPLHAAVFSGRRKCIRILLAAGVHVDGKIPAPRTEDGELTTTALHVAARSNYHDAAEALLDGGADPNAVNCVGGTPMHCAACEGRADMVLLLIRRGAHVNPRDPDGRTPLHEAVFPLHPNHGTDRLRAVQVLIRSGADVNAVDHEHVAPLDLARWSKRQDMVDLLKRHGAVSGEPIEFLLRAAEAKSDKGLDQEAAE